MLIQEKQVLEIQDAIDVPRTQDLYNLAGTQHPGNQLLVIGEMDCHGIKYPNNMIEEDDLIGLQGLDDVIEGTDEDEYIPDDDDVSLIDVMERDSLDANSLHGRHQVRGSMEGVTG